MKEKQKKREELPGHDDAPLRRQAPSAAAERSEMDERQHEEERQRHAARNDLPLIRRPEQHGHPAGQATHERGTPEPVGTCENRSQREDALPEGNAAARSIKA